MYGLRKLVVLQLAMLVVCAQTSGVLAKANPDTGPGCGLGKLAWSEYGHPKNIAPQVMMATTNGTFGSQTFGISFGTSGCTNDGQVMAEHKATLFAEVNFEDLSQDMARGGGEHLASLAVLLAVPPEHHAEFFAMTQDRYVTLVEAGEISPVAVVKALSSATQIHPTLAKLPSSR